MQRKRRSPKSLDLNEEMRTIVIGTFYVNNILVEKKIIRCMKWCQILHALYLLLLGLEGEKCVEQADYEVRMLAKHPFEGEVCLWVEITFCHDNPYILCKDRQSFQNHKIFSIFFSLPKNIVRAKIPAGAIMPSAALSSEGATLNRVLGT